ncbi:MAG: helix-turn-helix domain-containing protein [Clostridia bacterium]|nr:helix-turn-helix domain-containing protein [Clostridia bacterium]
MNKNFSEKLSELRKEKELSVLELSKLIGFSKSVIYFWENGQREPTANAIFILSKFFNVSSDYLLGLEDDLGNKNVSIQANFKLSSDEERLLRAFRSLSELEKGKLIEDAEFYSKRLGINKNKEAK